MRVALCAATYRRPRGLARLLKAMAVLELPASVPFALAVIIVDNSPEAEAREQVTKAAQDFNWPLLYVSEPRRGITFARNAALEKATALDCDFVAFIDDDEVPAPRPARRPLRCGAGPPATPPASAAPAPRRRR